MIEHYQNIVIGSGGSGKFVAWTQAALGERTVCVEKGPVGGACPNVACLPSKNVVHSAKVLSLFKNAAELGITTGQVKFDLATAIRHKQAMIDRLRQMHLDEFKKSGAELLFGTARFVEEKTIEVSLPDGGTRTLRGDRIFIDVGTHATIPNVPGLADAQPLTNVEILELKRLPEHLVILGGGYVGLEFAQAMRRFGSRVTIIEHGSQLLPREDADVAEALTQLMQDEGIAVRLKTDLVKVTGHSGESLQLEIRSGTSTNTLDASDLLVSVGRTPNSAGVDPANGGVEVDALGFFRVNDRLETTAPDVWAMGECAGSLQFTHVAFDDYRIVRDNLAGGNRTTRNRLVPYCLFTDPELAQVGLHESEARAQNVHYRLVKIPMAAILRTRTHGEERGFAKALIGDDDRLLGFTALGAEASELMAAAQTAILAGATYQTLGDAIYTHPTTAEGLSVMFADYPDRNKKPESQPSNRRSDHGPSHRPTQRSQEGQPAGHAHRS